MSGSSLPKNDGYVIFDNHMHLNPNGRFLKAVDMFMSSGGSTFNLVNLPEPSVTGRDHYELLYEKTVGMARRIKAERDIETAVTLGPYPLDYFRFQEKGFNPVEELKKGVDLAAKYISSGVAHAIGEIGRPHFPVPENVVADCDKIILYAMQKAAEIECPVILHTEDLGPAGYTGIESIARQAGLDFSLVVKHHALAEDADIKTDIQRSVLASKSNVRKLLSRDIPFLLETDYVDDISLDWKVIPPDSVPRRAQMIRNECQNWEDLFDKTFKRLPIALFGEELFRQFL